MLTMTEQIKADMAKAKVELAKVDKDIEEREERLSSLRNYREQKYRYISKLEGQLARENAPLVKPTGHCVREAHPNGSVWDV